jgi:hypothetical protein
MQLWRCSCAFKIVGLGPGFESGHKVVGSNPACCIKFLENSYTLQNDWSLKYIPTLLSKKSACKN